MKATLEQWRALVAVVDHGGFARAAEHLHRSQSTVSHAVRTLEERLGLAVFEIQGRRAVLTEAGRAVYQRAARLLEQAAGLEGLAGQLARGWEPEIRVAVEVIYPFERVFRALEAFDAECGDTRVEPHESVLSGTHGLVTGGEVDLGLVAAVPPGFVGEPLLEVEFVLVASPGHPLRQMDRTLTLEDLENYRHVVVRDTGTASVDAGWLAHRRWTVSSIFASIEAVTRGLGFAWLPRPQIQPRLDDGRLEPLAIDRGGRRRAVVHLVMTRPEVAGPACRRLAELLREAAAA